LVYENCKIYGPYQIKNGRKYITVIFPNKKKKNVSYPKYLMEKSLNRYLKDNETVDHIDCDFTNNDLSNLRVLDRSEHVRLDVKRYAEQEFDCPECGISFRLSGRKLHDAIHNRKKGRAGPFCSRSCAGKYSKKIQTCQINPAKVVQITPEYTTLKELKK
jgi:hypothetical protein